MLMAVPKGIQTEIKQTQPFTGLEEETAIALARTADQLARHCDELFKAHGLTATQYNVLRILRGAGKAGAFRGRSRSSRQGRPNFLVTLAEGTGLSGITLPGSPLGYSNGPIPASLVGRSPKPHCGVGKVEVLGREQSVARVVVGRAAGNSGEVVALRG